MAQYFRSVPLWVVGMAKIVRDTLIAITAISTFESPQSVLWLLILREMVGGFVKYSDNLSIVEPKTRTKNATK